MGLNQVDLGSSLSNLKILSLNCLGLANKTNSIIDLILDVKADVVLLQEVWAFNMDFFQIVGYKNIFVSAMDQNKLHLGRPHGGIAIVIKDSINFEYLTPAMKPKQVDLNIYSRVLGIELVDYKMSICNLYLPACDS